MKTISSIANELNDLRIGRHTKEAQSRAIDSALEALQSEQAATDLPSLLKLRETLSLLDSNSHTKRLEAAIEGVLERSFDRERQKHLFSRDYWELLAVCKEALGVNQDVEPEWIEERIALLFDNGGIPHFLPFIIEAETAPPEALLFVLRHVDEIPAESLVDVLQKARNLGGEVKRSFSLIERHLPEFSDQFNNKIQLAESLQRFSIDEREDALIQLKRFSTAPDRSKLLPRDTPYLGWMANIPSSSRKERVDLFFARLAEGKFFALKKRLFEALSAIPEEAWPAVSHALNKLPAESSIDKELLSLFAELPEKFLMQWSDETSHAFLGLQTLFKDIDIIALLYLLPPSLCSPEELSSLGEQSLFQSPAYRDRIVQGLLENLNSPSLPPDFKILLANWTIQRAEALHLLDSHPVVQLAIYTAQKSDLEGKYNPFAVYAHLKELERLPTDFKPPSQEVAGLTVQFNLARLRELAAQFSIPRSALHPDVTADRWKEAVERLIQKVEADPAGVLQVEEMMQLPWNDIKKTALLDFDFFNSLLRNEDDPVPLLAAQLNAFLHVLFQAQDTPSDIPPFSERELQLLKFASGCSVCPTGKKGAIEEGYRQLATEEKFQDDKASGDLFVLRAKRWLHTEIQNYIEDQFSGTNALMQELTGVDEVEEAVHQAGYLKNAIGPLVGLNHEVSFDLNSAMVYDDLFERPREELLELFFRHVSPVGLVRHLMAASAREFPYGNARLKGWDAISCLAFTLPEEAVEWDQNDLPQMSERFFPLLLIHEGILY